MPARSDGLDAFEVSASGGTVHVRGTSNVAICRGAYEYLKDACHVQVSWNGGAVKVPAKLPDYVKRSVVGPNRWRHYFNICTFGYTTVWWDWVRWQREIDWMALHGINMPLAMTGQDKVWQTTFHQLGVPQESIDKWFSGPAFLPWHWMGNLNGHMGPLSQRWIEAQAALQKRILQRERSLGMKPVVPGFSGFVPTDFSKFHPGVKLSSPTAWCDFAPTTFVDVRDPIFVQIGKRFVQNYRKEFGSDHFYLCDTFNEQNPQFPKETELDDLAASGRSVISALKAGDPDAVWVMQGWLFYNEANYWTVPRVEALMRDIPQNGMIVLDLATNESAVWKRLPPVRQMGWIYNTLHNYGQNTALQGDLQHLANRAYEDLNDPAHGKMLGMGLTPEGIEQNPVVYELMTDAMWTNERIDISKWIVGYVQSRYGSAPADAVAAWRMLIETVYGPKQAGRAAWRGRPSVRVAPPSYDMPQLREALRKLLSCRSLRDNERYQRDIVDVAKTWLGGLADARLAGALLNEGVDRSLALGERSAFFNVLDDLDRVMATRPEHRLSTWIADARQWGTTDAERKQYEANARTQVTVWGGPVLFDYANKEWAGLNKDFIQERWRAFFAARDQHASIDLPAWELAWSQKTGPVRESPARDPYDTVLGVFAANAPSSSEIHMPRAIDADPGIAVGKPVRASSNEPGHGPEAAVDGHVLGSYWAAGPAPQWLEVDLQAVCHLEGVTLFPYFGDERSYAYRIEVSRDGTTYEKVAEGEGPATISGYHHAFKGDARYVRVTMTRNSANPSVHIQELRVFGTP